MLLAFAGLAGAAQNQVKDVRTSSSLSQALTIQPNIPFLAAGTIHTAPDSKELVIRVDDRQRFQQYHGVGAALTDSAACKIAELPPAAQDQLIQRLFTTKDGGAGFNFLRVPMGASDFSCSGTPYTYDDMPPGQQDDANLSNFTIAHDLPYIIPALQKIVKANPNIQILANPWSAPAWMKGNDNLDNGLHGGVLLEQDYAAYAQYFVKFIQQYAMHGIKVNAVTPENEPDDPTGYPSMEFPEAAELNFITRYLRPALNAAGLSTKIYGFDNSWGDWSYVRDLTGGPSGNIVNGIAWHCYGGNPVMMSWLHYVAPSTDQVVDECSPELRAFSTAEELISSFRNWASIVAVWNLALDPAGGPVQPPNWGCKGCNGVVQVNRNLIWVNAGSHKIGYSQKYFQLAQFSRFIQPGAWRVASVHSPIGFARYTDFPRISAGLDVVTFLNPDGSHVLAAYNNGSCKIRFTVDWRNLRFGSTISAGEIDTYVWK
jgi:glucosylceramidase